MTDFDREFELTRQWKLAEARLAAATRWAPLISGIAAAVGFGFGLLYGFIRWGMK